MLYIRSCGPNIRFVQTIKAILYDGMDSDNLLTEFSLACINSLSINPMKLKLLDFGSSII